MVSKQAIKSGYSLPSVSISDKSLLPTYSGIYFVVSEVEVIYIGKTKNLKTRWEDHHIRPKLKKYFEVRVAWLPIEEDDLDLVEKILIGLYWPELNKNIDVHLPKDEDFNKVCQLIGRAIIFTLFSTH